MKLSVSRSMRWLMIVTVMLSVIAPMARSIGSAPVAVSAADSGPESVAQRILIKVKPGLDSPTGRLAYATPTPLARALTAQGVTTAQTLFRTASGVPSAIGLERIYRLELAANADVNKAVTALGTDPNIEWAEPDHIAHAVAIPNDPLYGEQWGLAKIDAPPAWDIVTGTQTVVIATVDSGIDLTHLDLQANLWANPGEIAGNGIDDDNNGYVDDVRGWNFVNGTNNVSDGSGHGTQVAGVAAAVTNNALGIAGVCWNCKIMPVRVMADSGVSNYSDIALGVKYAADKGAHVINLSLGGYAYSNALRDAINYAVNEKNVVVVAGAGNDNVSTPFYPAAYDNVLAVAGTTDVDTKAAFSDYGTWVDVSAPAVEITTTYMGGDWGPASGTSLAAPFVAGVAALIRSQHPPTEWNATMVRNQILQTADPIDTLNPTYAGQLGYGRVNAARTMQAPHPAIALAGISVNGDPLGRPIPGESATLAVTLRNDWWDAAGVTGVLSTADPFVTMSQATASYGNLASGASGTSSPIYTFTVAAGAGYNHPIPLILTVSADDGDYSVTLPFTITTRSGEELVCGSILQDTVWTSDKTYIATCNIGIAPGVILTIQPGTEVRFNDTYGLNVGGTLLADGTADQPIRMVANGANGWRGIQFHDASVDAQADAEGHYLSGNLLRHVLIEDSISGINVLSATPYLAHLNLDATTVISQSLSGSLGATPLWLMDSTISGAETAVSLAGAVNAHRNIITGVGLVVNSGSVTISSNTLSGGGIEVSNEGTISDNVITGGGIHIDGVSVIQQNVVQGGSIIARNTTTVISNTVRGGGIVVGENAEVRGNDVSGASEWGITGFPGTILLADGATNIRAIDNRIVGNQNGIAVASGLVQGNLIANNAEVGLALGEATVISNTLTGNRGSAVKVSWSQPLTFADNNLEGNLGQYDFENTTAAIDARNNWWGTTNTALIQQRIFDGNDDHNFGIVLFDPMLTAPNTTAPAYIRAVTLTPESPVGIQTVTFDVLLSREMDVNISPEMTFVSSMGWATRASMLTPKDGLAAAVAPNGRIYAIGGSNSNGYLATVEEYDPATNTWTTRAPMPTARSWFAAATAPNGRIYAIGGYNGTYLATVEEYDPATNTWTTRASMPTARLHVAVIAASNGRIYAIGGNDNMGYSSTVEEYDPTSDTWTTRTPMPTGRSSLAVASAPNGRIYAIGGIGLDEYMSSNVYMTVEEYDPATDTWTTRALMPTARHSLAAATAPNGRIYAIGGMNGNDYLATVEEYDPATDTWTTRAPMPTARFRFAVIAALNGRIYAIGGNSNGSSLAIVEELTPWVEYSGFYNGFWPTPNLYRATYDFSTLIPRDTYTITVSGAQTPETSNSDTVIIPIPGGGMEIAPNSAYTFTVDYAGAIADTTPPPAPSVIACAAETPDALSAEWSAKDPDSAITLYQYAIGTTSGGNEVVNWTSTAESSMSRSPLTLLVGQTYYISVKARNEGGLWSAPGSVGVVAGSGGCVSNVTQWNIYLPLVLRN